MEVIILAAGRGERLMPLTANIPKVLLPLWDGECILQKQLHTFESMEDINRAIVVTGYLTEKVEEKIKEWGYENFVDIAYNPFYRISNNLISLWFGIIKSTEDVIVTNGDNIFKRIVIEKLINAGDDGIYLAVDMKKSYDLDDMKVLISNNIIKYVSKQIEPREASAESTGIARFAGSGKLNLLNALEYLVRQEEYLNRYWLEVFNYLASLNKKITPVWIDEKDWQEMDIHSDKELIDYLLKNKIYGWK